LRLICYGNRPVSFEALDQTKCLSQRSTAATLKSSQNGKARSPVLA
jgi:hypothetical protein